MSKKHFIWFVSFWTILIITSFLWNRLLIIKNNDEQVSKKSQAFFDQIVMTRSWNSQHGGVYVPITAVTKPNPYLKDSTRDIVTINGIKLTKINPAYMTRQISEINKERLNFQFHITSINPIRPLNKPDDWETKALKSFEKGITEFEELVDIGPNRYFRYMAPLITEKSCLKCHAVQGYKEGDIRGGISVTFLADSYLKSRITQISHLALAHIIILIVGVVGLFLYYNMSKKYVITIQNKNEELQLINATKNKFFSIIAHDLRSPLGTLTKLGELLSEKHNEISAKDRELIIKSLYDSSKKTYNLLNNLLLWSSSESGLLDLSPDKINLKDMVNEIIQLFAEKLKEKKLHIEHRIEDSCQAYADRNMIDTVIRNLISNAIKFTPEEGKICISAEEKPNNYIEICISDTGVGISTDKLENIFNLGTKVSTEGTKHEKGTGLGLKLCKEFIEKNGGEIWAESIINEGSSFCFTLPIDKPV